MTLVASTALAEDAYDDAFNVSAALEQAGKLDEAASALEMVLPLYPQDYTLPLSIAWIHFRAGRFERAEHFYRLALAVSPGAADARLGLALAIERQQRCEEARVLYEGLAQERPDLAEAQAGLARCAPVPSWRVTAALSFSGVYFPDHPVKSLAGGGAVGGTFAHRSGFFFGGSYRYTRLAPASGVALDAWDQHEAYASLGYSDKLGGVAAHYAFLHDGSGAFGNSHHLGISARWSPFGDIELRGSASLYDDLKVFRVEPSWKIPIAFGLSIRPAIAVQYAGEVLTTGMGTLSFDHPRLSLWAGGKYGDEVRPVYFGVPAIYDVSEKIAYGAWAGASVNVSNDVRIHLSYAMDRLKQSDGTATNAHAMTLGIAASF
ncbi:MAG: tetratricopeptide repeat protein [Minicystis sp.]